MALPGLRPKLLRRKLLYAGRGMRGKCEAWLTSSGEGGNWEGEKEAIPVRRERCPGSGGRERDLEAQQREHERLL